MKSLSVSQLKGVKQAVWHLNVPRDGSKIKQIYDLFCDNKGKVISFPRTFDRANILQRLRYEFGLDIRCMKHKTALYCLVGEWFDEKYIDYAAQNENEIGD